MHNHVPHASAFILTPPFAPPLRRTVLALLLAGCFGAAQANPALPQVVNGQATFNQQGNIFSITNTPNTIINWQSFSIHAGEITRFIQQNGNSAVLNRITGQDPSKILGSLESNGKVFLINPNGIVFGQGAKVDVNGLVASSLGMTNEDFLAGKRQFTAGGVAGGVGNAGTINAGKGGQVLLIAPNVENTGIITAPNGEVILAAGRSVQLADPGNPQLRVLVSAPSDQALNLGQIIAQGGSIGMAGALVSQRGVLNANSAVVGDNGRIVLKASGKALLEAGSVTSATGTVGKGGDIQVLGEQVGLLGNAKVDASGATGGGTVLLGGDYQGKNAAVQNARQVLVGKDASVTADAVNSGNGGKVIAWGDESAQVHGSISARGGAQGGDGGFVETSGHYLAVDGIRVNTSAARGKRGNWLIDPYDITVIAGSDGQLGDVDQFADAPSTGNASIGADLISGASSNVTLQATHRINFNSAINIMQQGVGLTAQAGETINVNASISTNGGAVRLLANDASSGSVGAVGSHVNLAAPITSNGGSVYLSGAGVSGAGVVNAGSGHLSLISNFQGGAIDLTGSGDQLQGSGIAGQTVILQADNIGINGTLNFGGTAGGANVIIKPLSSVRSIDLGTKSGAALSLNAVELAGISAASLTIGDGTNTGGLHISDALARTGDLHLNSGSAITATGAVTVDGSFVLDGGSWMQNGAVLPGFSARSFAIGSGASFLRVTGGDGVTSPYLLVDIYGLQGIASLGLGNSYRLAGNIDASGTVNWNDGQGFVPIAGSGSGFSGVFDGAGFTLSNLKIDRSLASGSAAGLFGTVQGGTLRNLTLSGGSVTGTANVGALAGNVVSGTIDNVNSSMAVSGQRNVGGLVGSNGGAITLSSSSGAVTGVNADNGGAIGGLAGWNAPAASITTSYATGVVTGAREMIGGLVGNNQGALSQSYATGNVTGARGIGGLVGLNGGSIDDAYASGAVGRSGSADPILARENMGGLVGESTGSVSHVFSSGAVTGDGYAAVGAVAGRVSAGSPFSYGFFNYETSLVQMDAGGSSGRSTAQMQQQGSFNDYNFNSVWRIYEGYTTPMLKAFLKPLQVNLSGNATGKVYDGQLAAFLGSIGYVGLLDGDTGVNGSLGYGNARNVGSYAATGLWSTKYDITLGGTTTFAITPRALTVGIGGNGKVYDGALGYDGASFVLGNLVTGDNISVSGSAAFLDKNVGGSKAVHASGLALVGNELGNYSLAATTADGTAAITARLLNYGVSGAQSRVYDGSLQAALNGYFEGLVTGDQVSLAGLQGSFRDKNAGTGKVVDYQVATGHLTGADAGNYVLNGNAGSTTADITARTLNVSFNGVNKTYDGTTGAQVNFGDDRIQGDALSVAGNAAFGNKKAGLGKAVHVTNVALSGGDADNYVLNANAGSTTADIAARTLNVSFNGINKTYDGTTGAQVGFGDDRISGDNLTVAGSAAFGNKNAGIGKTVTVTNVALSGGDAANYVLNAKAGSTTADIAARTLNVSFSGINKTYDGTTGAQVNFGDDRISGDNLTVAGSAAFGNKNAGIGKTVTVMNVALSGGDADNYVLNANAGSTTADIAARTLNVSFSGINKTYDGTTGAQVNFGDDRVQGDALTVAGNAAFGNKNAGTGKAVNVTNVALSGGDAGNYVLNANAGSTTADIAARTLNVSFNGVNKTYDGTTGAQVSFGDDRVQGDTLTVAGNAAFGNKNAGAGKAVNVSNVGVSGSDAGNYVLSSNAGSTTADIAARTLNVSFNGVNKTYDGTTSAQVNFGDDRVQGDTLTVAGNAAFGNKNAGAGKAINVMNVALSGGDAGNYVLNANAGSTTADIAARTLNVSFNGVNKTYDGTTGAQVSFGDDRIQGDALSVAGNAAFGNKNAGTGKAVNVTSVALSGGDAGNYVLGANIGSTTADIAARTLNVSFNGVNKTYDGTTGAQVSFGDDRVQGDALTVAGNAAFGNKNAGAGKAVNVMNVALSGGDAGNYVLNANAGSTTADIAARTLNMSFNGVNKTYDGTTGAQVNFGDDRVQGDTLTVAGNAVFGNKNAGTGKAVNVTNVGVSGGDAGNYVLNANAGSTTADIAARTLNVSFSGVNKTYDGTTGAQVNFGDDRIQGDALTVAGSAAFGNKNAGTGKAVNVTNVALSGGDAGNYVLSAKAGSTTADIAARTLNVSFNGVNKTYDGTTSAQVNFGDDRVQGDTLTVAGNAAFGNKNAGNGKAVNVSNVGVSGSDAGNYVLSSNTGSTTADIAARTLNVSLNGVNKTYDGTTGAQVSFGDDRVQGDTLTVAGNAAFGNKNAGAGKAVNVTNVALSGGDAGNYVLGANAGSTTADIGARALNLSGVAGSKVYDGTTGAQLSLGDDRVAGDSLIASAVANFADKNVGAGKAVQVGGAALTGADAGNYFIVLPTGLLASITPASLTLAGLSAAGKVYDGTTSAVVSASANGVLGQDVVSVVGGSGSFADKNAGAGKLVTASGFRLAGADAGNYILETTGGTAQASIAQKQLSTWIGSGNGLWSDAANWDGGVVPEGANVLAVDFSNSKGTVTYSAAAGNTILKNLNSATGLLLTGGSLTLGESALDRSVLGGLAGLEINGGSLLLNGSLSADRYAQGGGVLSGSGNLLVANSFNQTAGAIRLTGQLAITQAAGDLRFASMAANTVQLSALNGAIGQDGALLAGSVAAQARDGIVLGNAGNQVGSFTASNSAGGGIALNNTSAPGTLTLGTLVTGAGNITIDNTGGVAAGNINANGGNVSVTAHSPVTVSGKVAGNDIALNASTDVLLGDGAQLAAARDVSVTAGRDISVGGNAKIVSGGNFSASAGASVRFADTASVTLPATGSMSVLAKTGSITGDSGVRVNRQRSGATLLAPNGAVNMADAIFLPATTIDPPVIDPATSAAIDDALRIIKQADRANDPLASTPSAKPDDKKKDSKDVADATDKPTGYKFDDPAKKMYCN